MMDSVRTENVYYVVVVVWFVTDLKINLFVSFCFSTIFTLLIIKMLM